MEALQTATRNPGRFLRIDAGTIEVGKRADLVLLDANPLDDIRNMRKIRAVVLDGKLLDRSRLDTLRRR
jgi:imidazolonepropionase-like amidohydrolase